jgi:arginine/lysine/ornithine decarboxylase
MTLDDIVGDALRPHHFCKPLPKRPEDRAAIREAAFAPAEEIAAEDAEGRVCASVKVPCPPAVPIAVSGEIIDRSCIEVFRAYGIGTVLVMKN